MAQVRKITYLLLLLTLVVLLVSCEDPTISTPSVEVDTKEALIEEVEEFDPPVEVSIVAVGDIMVHGPQLKAQYNAERGEYDFSNNFQYIEAYIKEGDLAIANLETTFGGKERGYSSFPMFNSPDSLGDALKEAGFHIISTVNNHTIDTGSKGMIRTIEVLEDRGLEVMGTRKEESMKNFIIKDIKGVKIGLTAYTYETPRYGEYRTLNGLKIPKEVEGLINSFSYEGLEDDLIKIEETINRMRAEGAEIVVIYLHWGEEYQRQPNQYQRSIAEKLRSYGVDIVFGSHPHVIQPIEILESEDDDKKTLVVYSMGNFLSNQRYEILKNRYTEDGIIINVKIKKDFKENKVALEEVSYIPTWVHRYRQTGAAVYEIIPVIDVLENQEKYSVNSNEILWRVENSKNNTLHIIESNGTWTNQKQYVKKEE